MDDVRHELDQLAQWTEAQEICSVLPGLPRANVSLDAIEDPHELQSLDFAVLLG